jgi:hypothetical protein
MATFAVALAPSLLVLSAGRIGRLLRRLAPSRAEMRRQPKASQPREQQITISAWRKVSANDSIYWSLTAIGSLFAIILILTRPQSE